MKYVLFGYLVLFSAQAYSEGPKVGDRASFQCKQSFSYNGQNYLIFYKKKYSLIGYRADFDLFKLRVQTYDSDVIHISSNTTLSAANSTEDQWLEDPITISYAEPDPTNCSDLVKLTVPAGAFTTCRQYGSGSVLYSGFVPLFYVQSIIGSQVCVLLDFHFGS